MPETSLEDRSEALLVLATNCQVMRLEPRHYEALRDFLDHAPGTKPPAVATLEPVLAICAECQAREKLLRECHLSLQLSLGALRRWFHGHDILNAGSLITSIELLVDRLVSLPALSDSTGRPTTSEPKRKEGTDGGV